MDDNALVKTSHKAIQIVFALGLMAGPAVQADEIYRWVDKDGRVHFADKQPDAASAEKVIVDPPEVGEPDEGELRRRALIEQAEAAFKLKQKEAQEAQAKELDDNLGDGSKDNISKELCEQAQIRYGVLQEQMPIYWTTDGQLRPAWSNDTYQGERTYVADENRPKLLKQVANALATHCKNPDDMAQHALTYRRWEHAQWCAAFKVKIKAARQPRSKTPEDTIEAMEEKYAKEC